MPQHGHPRLETLELALAILAGIVASGAAPAPSSSALPSPSSIAVPAVALRMDVGGGFAPFPWFLTKMIVPIYSGWFLARYCPEPSTGAPQDTGTMWLIYGLIAISSSLLLILSRGWLGKDFKTKAD